MLVAGRDARSETGRRELGSRTYVRLRTGIGEQRGRQPYSPNPPQLARFSPIRYARVALRLRYQ